MNFTELKEKMLEKKTNTNFYRLKDSIANSFNEYSQIGSSLDCYINRIESNEFLDQEQKKELILKLKVECEKLITNLDNFVSQKKEQED